MWTVIGTIVTALITVGVPLLVAWIQKKQKEKEGVEHTNQNTVNENNTAMNQGSQLENTGNHNNTSVNNW